MKDMRDPMARKPRKDTRRSNVATLTAGGEVEGAKVRRPPRRGSLGAIEGSKETREDSGMNADGETVTPEDARAGGRTGTAPLLTEVTPGTIV